MTDITSIIVQAIWLIVGIIGILATRYLKPWVEAKIDAVKADGNLTKYEMLKTWMTTAVEAAEVLVNGTRGLGAKRRDIVLAEIKTLCEQHNVTYDEDTVRNVLEEAVVNMKADGIMIAKGLSDE